jgi:4-aminobutyrate aminotransferase
LLARDEALIGNNNKVRFYPLVADSAQGSTITDPDGRTFLDFGAGWAVANTGYGHPKVVEAVSAQVQRLSFASLATVTHPAAINAAQELVDITPTRGPRKVAFGHSGSDSNEGAAKLLAAFTGRPKLITFLGSMHGMGAGSASMSGHPSLGSSPGSANVTRVPYPNPYRAAIGGEEDCGREVVRFIEEQILTTVSPPEMTSAILVEPIQSDGGVVVPPRDFLPDLRSLCDRYGLLLAMDEVKVGMGRSGKMWACELTDTVPDLVVAGKAVGSGIPISAIIGPRDMLDSAAAAQIFTTAGGPIQCAALSATINVIEKESLADKAAILGDYIMAHLRKMQPEHPMIGDVRGCGLIIGVELVRNRDTKEPARKETAKLAYRCYQLGLLLDYVGLYSNVVEITPPLVLTREEADRGLEIFSQGLADVEQGKVTDEEVAAYEGW